MTNCRKRNQKGTQVLEFALVVGLLVPMMLYVVVIGIDLGRAVQTAQIARDAGSMFVRGVDFSQTPNQSILARLGQSLGLAATGGTGIVILSKVTYIPANGCTAPCNQNQYVLVQRLIVGDSSLFPARTAVITAGTPTLDSQGNVLNYVTDASAVVSGFSTILTLNTSEFAYVAESYFPSAGVDMPGFLVGNGNYSRTIF